MAIVAAFDTKVLASSQGTEFAQMFSGTAVGLASATYTIGTGGPLIIVSPTSHFTMSSDTFIWEGNMYFNGVPRANYLQCYEGDGTTLHFNLGITGGFGTAKWLYQRNGTTLGTGANIIPQLTHIHYAIKVVIHDTTGSVVAYMDGVEDINISGVDTRNGGTSGIINRIQMGNGAGGNNYMGPFYVADSGSISTTPIKVAHLMPDAAGDDADWTPSTGSNYATVDETPLSETDYNSSDTDLDKDTFNLEASSGISALGTIHAVVPYAIGENDDATARSVNTIIKQNGTEGAGSDIAFANAAWRFVHHVAEVNPDTSSAWSASELDSALVGYELSK